MTGRRGSIPVEGIYYDPRTRRYAYVLTLDSQDCVAVADSLGVRDTQAIELYEAALKMDELTAAADS